MTFSHLSSTVVWGSSRHNRGISWPYHIAACYSNSFYVGGGKQGSIFSWIFKVVSRNNNLHPDCLCTLAVAPKSVTGGIRMETAQVKKNLHALDLFSLIELVSSSHLEFHTVPTETAIIPPSAAEKQRSWGIFHTERWLTAVHSWSHSGSLLMRSQFGDRWLAYQCEMNHSHCLHIAILQNLRH